MHERLLIAALNERQRVAELIQCLAQPGHVSVAEDPQRSRDQPTAMPVRHRILPGQVRDEGLRNGQPHRTSGCVAHDRTPLLIAPLAALAPRGSRFVAAYFVVARGRKACPLTPPQHGAARSDLPTRAGRAG